MATPPAENTPPNASRKPRATRTLRFVVVFIAAVLALLTAYRFVIETELKGAYLFQVARHSAWLLDLAGDSAEAQDLPGGPFVRFVLKPGLDTRLRDLERELRVKRSQGGGAGLSTEALDTLQSEVAGVREQRQAALADEKLRHTVSGYQFSYWVVPECGAIEVMAIFLAAVIAFPTPWWKRMLGVFAGLPILYLINIFRLACLAIIGALNASGKWFKFAHEYVWQSVYVVFVVAVWLAWVEFIVKRKS